MQPFAGCKVGLEICVAFRETAFNLRTATLDQEPESQEEVNPWPICEGSVWWIQTSVACCLFIDVKRQASVEGETVKEKNSVKNLYRNENIVNKLEECVVAEDCAVSCLASVCHVLFQPDQHAVNSTW